MRFDPHLAVAILRELEARDDADGTEAVVLRIEGYELDLDPRKVSYHVAILAEAGLLHARQEQTRSGGMMMTVWHPSRLTWDGHEALVRAAEDIAITGERPAPKALLFRREERQ